jgi:non-specific serine/threonine protein kinase
MSTIPDTLATALAGRYRIERELGRGGMATVYLAEDLKHSRQVAVKVMRPEIAGAIGPDRFQREIEFAARLNHPHILSLFDSGAAGSWLYYVTPYIEGESLRARLDREKQLPIDDVLRLTREVASALAHAHQRGLVHRDVKPENILLADGIALVADFGIARALEPRGSDGRTLASTAPGLLLGTPRYMSPEQAGGVEVDERSDLYALACVLYEMLAGEPPFTAASPDALLRMHMTVEPRPVTDLRPTVPPAVAAVLARALAKLPADRYASAARLAEALVAATSGGPTPTPGPSTREAGVPNNLPKQRSSFIGRERELAECERLFGETRLLTLTGIGGCGKTRLAVQLAHRLLAQFPDGVWFVDLGPLGEGERVIDAAATAFGVREDADKSLLDSIRLQVRDARVLLLLDNCEHLLAPSAELADSLLAAGEGVRILATSREGLGIEGERLFALRSLAVPTVEESRDPSAVAETDAVKLFVDRARATTEFALDAANAPVVGEICRRLDGIPLAIELAAARVKILSVEQIRARLDDRFRLLTGGSKTALPRHQTLRAALQWSYDQLAADEQRLLRLLSAFVGGWTLEAAARVFDEAADEFPVMELLGRLVDKSLVIVDRLPGGELRYRLLETVRQFARERLADAGEAESVRERHLVEYLALAERAYADRFADEESWSATLEREHDNLRAALEVVRGTDPSRHLQLAGALAWFWQLRSHLREGNEQLTQALEANASAASGPPLARALWGVATLMAWRGDPAAADSMRRALELWRGIGDRREVATALEGIGWTQLLAGEDEASLATFEESLTLQREIGDPILIRRGLVAVGQSLVALGEVERARATSREILADPDVHADRRSEHFAWHYLADCALIDGAPDQALPLYQQSLRLADAIGDRLETSFEIQGVAMSLAGIGDLGGGVRLAEAAVAEWRRIGADPRMQFWDELLERYLGPARQALGATEATRIRDEAKRITFEEAITEALGSTAS